MAMLIIRVVVQVTVGSRSGSQSARSQLADIVMAMLIATAQV